MTNRLQLLILFCLLFFGVTSRAIAQTGANSIFSSPQTQAIIIHAQMPTTGGNEFAKLLEGLKQSLEKVEDIYYDRIDPHGLRYKLPKEDGLDAFLFGAVTDIPFFGGAIDKHAEYEDKKNAQDMQPFIQERLFGQTSSLNTYFSHIREACNNDRACITQVAKDISDDPSIHQLLEENPGLIEQAKLTALIEASSVNADENHGQALEEFASQQELIAAAAASVHTQLSQVLANEETLIQNTATIIHTQQEHTIALTRIQEMIAANQAELVLRLNQGFGEVIELQKENILLSETILLHTQTNGLKLDTIRRQLDTIGMKLDDLGDKVDLGLQRQLGQIFNDLPLSQKLRMLEGAEGKELIADENKRLALIENLKILIRQEQIVAVTKKVREWGIVSLEALNVFYPDCPPEIKRVVSIAITASDIMGSITTGNWSQAILSGLSLFKSPRPGPEMQMLQKISEQLTNLESSMNAQFQQVHERLFAMETNLTARLEIIDQKLNIISDQIQFTYTELSEQLLSVNSQLSYISKQNECTDDLILDIFRSSNNDICEVPVKLFKDELEKGLVNSWNDLEEFFIGKQCKSCIETLFFNASQNLLNSHMFRYSYCNTASATNNNRPDNIYDFVFNRLVPDSIKSNPFALYSILSVPTSISSAASMIDSIQAMPDSLKSKIAAAYSQFTITESDRHYRHYMAVLELVDYVLTMMPFLELYNDGALMTYEQILARPEITRARSETIVGFLDNLSELIDHTVFQQSLMTGMSSFKVVDQFMEFGDMPDASGMTLTDLFTFNPILSKNYSAYFIEKNYGGLKNLNRILKNKPFSAAGKYYQGNNSYESLLLKDSYNNITLSTNWSTSLEKKPIFQCYLPGITGGAADTLIYENNLLSAIPRSLPALLSAKRRINLLSAEMRFIISDELDKPDAPLTRKELDFIIATQKNL